MTITVYGTPAPQGSKRFVGVHGGHGVMVESSKAVKPWREAVRSEAQRQMMHEGCIDATDPVFIGPVRVAMVFTLPRPKSAKKGAVPSKKPDLSKLVRATEDALTDAGVWEDDARVVMLSAAKYYPLQGAPIHAALTLDRPGAVIVIDPL